MKKSILLTLFLAFCFSASGQKKMVLIEGYKEEPLKIVAYIQDKDDHSIDIQTSNPNVSFTGKINRETESPLELYKEYVFWLFPIDPKTYRKRKAEIIEAVFTTNQIQKDQAKAANKVKQLTQNQ